MPITLMNSIAYSPIASLTSNFDSGATSLTVTEGAAFPAAPFYAILTEQTNNNFQSNDPLAYETILVTVKSGDTLSGITRAVEGIQNAGDGGTWISGDYIAAFWTAKAYTDFKDILSAATFAATASTLMERDADGRARVSEPEHSSDIATKKYIDDYFVMAGTETYNSTTGVVIEHNLGHTDYRVLLTSSESAQGYLGEVYMVKDVDDVTIYNTGSCDDKNFDYLILAK